VQLSLDRRGDVHILRVEEAKLTYPALSTFFVKVLEVVDDGAREVVIDLERVSFIDSAAIGCLVDIHRLLKEREGAVKLSGLQPRVDTMLSMAGLNRILSVHRHTADAVAAFVGPDKTKPQ
jgi:anti-sigma B factor antagonist